MDIIPRTVLSIDDNEVDGALLQRAIKRTAVPLRIFAITEASQALSYLAGDGIYADREQYPLPDLILLDIRMPKMSGLDVLAWIKERVDLKKVPVAILSSSTNQEDRAMAEKGGALAFYLKPSRFQDLQDLVRTIYTEQFERGKKPKTAAKSRKSASSDVESDTHGSPDHVESIPMGESRTVSVATPA